MIQAVVTPASLTESSKRGRYGDADAPYQPEISTSQSNPITKKVWHKETGHQARYTVRPITSLMARLLLCNPLAVGM